MKKIFLSTIILSVALGMIGCSSSAPSDNSAEIKDLKAQIESLQAENNELKKSLEDVEVVNDVEPSSSQNISSDTVLALNEEGTLDDWNVIVTNVEVTDSIQENNYASFKPEEGNKYLAIEITVTNNGKSASTFLPSFSMGDDIVAKIIYQNEYEFSATQLLGYSKELHNTTVNPLSTKNGVISFEIPDSVASNEDELLLVISAGKNNLQIKVR